MSILYFIVVPIAYLSFDFIQASGLTLLCLGTLFLAYLIVDGLGPALAVLFPYSGGFAFFAAVSTALVQQQKDRQRAEQLLAELEDAHQQLRAYAAQIEALAVAEERNRLAREIHDSLGHYLTAMTMQLQAAGKLPVLAGTPVPQPKTPITPDNVTQMAELAIWGKGQAFRVAYSPDGKRLAVGNVPEARRRFAAHLNEAVQLILGSPV